jgi:hypothetical protein
MVDNHAARTAEQSPADAKKRGWVSKLAIFIVFVGVVAALVLLT